jgi:hypothetical protein
MNEDYLNDLLNNAYAELTAERERADTIRAEYSDELKHLRAALTAERERVAVSVEALERLARLGNEPHYGNSHGNVIARDALRSALAVVREQEDRAERGWLPGEPPKPYRDEWFIAETIHGDRVVLKALSEECTYNYRTADETYFAAKSIKRWMQFPDSEYVSAAEAERVSFRTQVAALEAEIAALLEEDK